ncbi:MAG: hypothetical protein CM15mP31_3370 [Gammaproteobacteria bacterium]|nr:MAG: hypothetical protein CM15mP31_3370 [Gammaproteobacteria bacterium]
MDSDTSLYLMPSRSSAFELSLTIALPRNFLAGFKAGTK